MQKIEQSSNPLKDISGFTFIGDPGCDGLGVEIMSIFNAACHEAAGDFILIGGDIVPEGTDRLYQNVVNMLDSDIRTPVYMLAGNHDTMDYETYFGQKNYYLYDSKCLLIVLDNSKRSFSQETIDLLSAALKVERDNIIVSFHIPPPNRVSKNAVSDEEWAKVMSVLSPVRDKVKYILCGHVHSYFEDDIDGIQLVASGGGGARIEDVEGVVAPYYHYVELSFDASGKLFHTFKPIAHTKKTKPTDEVFDALKEAYAGECMAFVRYRIYAEEAMRQNKPNLAKLFSAAADSEFHHARNFYYAMAGLKPLDAVVSESIENESDEVNQIYPSGEDIAKNHQSGLAAYAFNDARMAERVHLRLFNEAKESIAAGKDIDEKQYLNCTSCGYTMIGQQSKIRCPICGAPPDKIYAI